MIFTGFHCPKIRTARARNPYPATSALKLVDVGTTNTSPPKPPRTPDMRTPAYCMRQTLMPAASAAWGCSPQERSLRPNLVR